MPPSNVIATVDPWVTAPRSPTTPSAVRADDRRANGLATAVYDAVSNAVAQVDPLGNRTSFAYDALGR
jgi:hypothetical protein